VPGGGGRCALEAAFCNRKFWAQNPFAKPARMEVRAVLPAFLASRGWAMRFDNPGGGSFTLGPRDSREIRPVLLSGRDFSAAELADAGGVTITVLVLAEGLVVGGLSFALDPGLSAPARERSDCTKQRPKSECCRPECRRLQRCCCEPCIDDRCRPQKCCDERCPEDRCDERCGKEDGSDDCDEDRQEDRCDRPRCVRIEIEVDAKCRETSRDRCPRSGDRRADEGASKPRNEVRPDPAAPGSGAQ
jgi:hypothetical protein